MMAKLNWQEREALRKLKLSLRLHMEDLNEIPLGEAEFKRQQRFESIVMLLGVIGVVVVYAACIYGGVI